MAAPVKKTVELFYDVISPYTWFAFEVLCRYQKKWDIDLQLKPFFLGGIMQGADNKPPGFVPNKALYMQKELSLLSKYYDVPLKHPKDVGEVLFVKGSLSAQRYLTSTDIIDPTKTEALSRELWLRIWSRDVGNKLFSSGSFSLLAMLFITAVDMIYPEYTQPLSIEFWHRLWSRDEDITKPESFEQAGKSAGMSKELIHNCLNRIKDQEVKDRLKQYTEEALTHGAFGSPTIIAHVGKPVMLFGSDRFPVLAQVLGEKWEGPTPVIEDSKL